MQNFWLSHWIQIATPTSIYSMLLQYIFFGDASGIEICYPRPQHPPGAQGTDPNTPEMNFTQALMELSTVRITSPLC